MIKIGVTLYAEKMMPALKLVENFEVRSHGKEAEGKVDVETLICPVLNLGIVFYYVSQRL